MQMEDVSNVRLLTYPGVCQSVRDLSDVGDKHFFSTPQEVDRQIQLLTDSFQKEICAQEGNPFIRSRAKELSRSFCSNRICDLYAAVIPLEFSSQNAALGSAEEYPSLFNTMYKIVAFLELSFKADGLGLKAHLFTDPSFERPVYQECLEKFKDLLISGSFRLMIEIPDHPLLFDPSLLPDLKNRTVYWEPSFFNKGGLITIEAVKKRSADLNYFYSSKKPEDYIPCRVVKTADLSLIKPVPPVCTLGYHLFFDHVPNNGSIERLKSANVKIYDFGVKGNGPYPALTIDGFFYPVETVDAVNCIKAIQLPTRVCSSELDDCPAKTWKPSTGHQLLEKDPILAMNAVHHLFGFIGAEIGARVHMQKDSGHVLSFVSNYIESMSREASEAGIHADYFHFLNGRIGQHWLITAMLYVTNEDFDAADRGMGTIFISPDKTRTVIKCQQMRLVIFQGDVQHTLEPSKNVEDEGAKEMNPTWRISITWKLVLVPEPGNSEFSIRDRFMAFFHQLVGQQGASAAAAANS